MSNTDYGTRPERISCQLGCIQSFPGILKAIQFVCDAIALILGLVAPSTDYTGQKGFYTFVAALAIVITTIFIVLACINLQAICIPRRWLVIEMFWCAFIAILYLISSIIAATIAKNMSIYGAAAFFGFAAMLAYVVDGVNRFRLTRAGPPGRRTYKESTTTTTVTQQ